MTERLSQSLILKVRDYHFSERLYLLRCIKHLLSYWKEEHHPYMVGYDVPMITTVIMVKSHERFAYLSSKSSKVFGHILNWTRFTIIVLEQ